MTSPADKLRKLMALAKDPASTAGEREACEAAIDRIKKSMPAATFREAQAEARENNPRAEEIKEQARQQQDANFRRMHEEFVRQFFAVTNAFARARHDAALKDFNQKFEELQAKAREDAYPKAYRDRR
jgi:hypothetical protein